MLIAEFYDLGYSGSKQSHLLHNMDIVASWADLAQGFIDHHANPRQLVQNLTHSIKFEFLLEGKIWEDFELTFDFESEPLPIITCYF